RRRSARAGIVPAVPACTAERPSTHTSSSAAPEAVRRWTQLQIGRGRVASEREHDRLPRPADLREATGTFEIGSCRQGASRRDCVALNHKRLSALSDTIESISDSGPLPLTRLPILVVTGFHRCLRVFAGSETTKGE